MKDPLNQVYYLSPDNQRYYFFFEGAGLLSHTNWGMPDFRFIEDSGPNQHGTTVRDYRANARTITMEFFRHRVDCRCRDCSLADIIDVVRPNRSAVALPGYLRVVTPRQQMREIPVRIQRGPNGNYSYDGPIGKRDVRDVVQFYASDPFWRDVKQITVDLTASMDVFDSCLDGSDLTCLPMCLEDDIISGSVDIQYCGTWDGDQITIVITGPVTGPRIVNETSGKTIELNYSIASNETVTITILPESVTVTNNFGQNLIGTVTNLSDLVNFVLLTDSVEAPDGINEISFSGLNAIEGSTGITISWYDRHISVYGSSCDTNCVSGALATPVCACHDEDPLCTEVCCDEEGCDSECCELCCQGS